MYAEVTNGVNTGLLEMLRKVKAQATATGGRSAFLKKQPCWYQKAVDEFEHDFDMTLFSWILWADLFAYQKLPFPNHPDGPPGGFDTGGGDIYIMMEMFRTAKLMEKVKALCKDAK